MRSRYWGIYYEYLTMFIIDHESYIVVLERIGNID